MNQFEINEHGEVQGFGPVHACDNFGHPGHNYFTCPQCRDRFQLRLQHLGHAPVATS